MHREQKELLKDVANIAIGFTPIWWAISISRFAHKWGYKRRGISRIQRHMRKRRGTRTITQAELDGYLDRPRNA